MVVAVVNPTDLIAEHRAEQFAVLMHFFASAVIMEFELLINVERFMSAGRLAGAAAVGGGNVEARAGKQGRQVAGALFVEHGTDVGPDGHPFFKGDIPALEQQSELLAIHSGGLGEPVIKIDQAAAGIPDGALDLFFDGGGGADGALGCDDLARAKPPAD